MLSMDADDMDQWVELWYQIQKKTKPLATLHDRVRDIILPKNYAQILV
jgi:hypothetical protein